MHTWITIGAPGSNVGNATVEVYIGSGGTPIGTYSVAPGSQVHPDYPGVFDGAVRVVSTDGKDIFASERQIYGGSFSETMGIPANRLDTEYWFPLYDLADDDGPGSASERRTPTLAMRAWKCTLPAP